MSKGKKSKNYKISPITCIEEGLGVLGSLIMATMCHLEKYVAYVVELDDTMRQYVKIDESTESVLETKPVPEVVYHNLNDKLMYRQMMILKLLADEQNASFSYKSVRKIFKRQGYLASGLSQENNEILNEQLATRNWIFHNPQSLYTAKKEVLAQSIPDSLQSMVKVAPQINPVYIRINEFFDVAYLYSLSLHVETKVKQFNTILESMKQDYKEMYQKISPKGMQYFNGQLFDNSDVEFKIYREKTLKQLLDTTDMVAQISMAIQQGKYDGTDEVFHKWTLNRFNNHDST